jgi:hypothetical protein
VLAVVGQAASALLLGAACLGYTSRLLASAVPWPKGTLMKKLPPKPMQQLPLNKQQKLLVCAPRSWRQQQSRHASNLTAA